MDDTVVYTIDFEGSLKSGILEYGIVGVSFNEGIFFTETKLCKNRCSIPDKEVKCHGISSDLVCGCEDFSASLYKFLDWRSKAYFCAHNAAFENSLLNSYCPVVLQGYRLATMPENHWGPWLDTYFLYKKFKKTSCGLSELIKELGLEEILSQLGEKFCPFHRKKFHCALFDAIACALLLLNFVRNERSEQKTLQWLLKESSPQGLGQNIQQANLFY